MPYQSEKKALLDPFLDRRTKLLPCQRERLLRLREAGGTYQEVADVMGVSKRSAYFVVNPEKKAENKARSINPPFDKAKHAAAMRAHRQHKHTVFPTKK